MRHRNRSRWISIACAMQLGDSAWPGFWWRRCGVRAACSRSCCGSNGLVEARLLRWGILLPTVDSEVQSALALAGLPQDMWAAVYTGESTVRVQSIPVPEIGPGEILIKVHSCGICHTDLKKIAYNLLTPPRVYGHETAGEVAAAGEKVRNVQPGDRVLVFHHIPCMECFYCRHKLYAQCQVYKKVGVTAGFEPAGGGFSQYVRIMDWIVE